MCISSVHWLYVRLELLRILPMGDMYVVKNSGPKNDPCGTPCFMETVEKV